MTTKRDFISGRCERAYEQIRLDAGFALCARLMGGRCDR